MLKIRHILLLFSLFATSLFFAQQPEKSLNMIFVINGDAEFLEISASEILKELGSQGGDNKINVLVQFSAKKGNHLIDKLDLDWSGIGWFKLKDNGATAYKRVEADSIFENADDFPNPNSFIDSFYKHISEKYPARKTITIFWDHGNLFSIPMQSKIASSSKKSYITYLYDLYAKYFGKNNKVPLTKSDFEDRLFLATTNSPYKLFISKDLSEINFIDLKKLDSFFSDIIVFNACSLANIEVGLELKNKTKVLIANQDIIEGRRSFRYSKLIKHLKRMSHDNLSELAEVIVKTFPKSGSGNASAINIESLDEVSDAILGFSDTIRKRLLDDGPKTTIHKKIKAVSTTLGSGRIDATNVDLITFLNRFKLEPKLNFTKTQVEQIKAKFYSKKTILANSHRGTYNGLNIYFPTRSPDSDYDNFEFSKKTKWDVLLKLAINYGIL